MSRVVACLMSEGREFQDLAPKEKNERSPLVLQLNLSQYEGIFRRAKNLDGRYRSKNVDAEKAR